MKKYINASKMNHHLNALKECGFNCQAGPISSCEDFLQLEEMAYNDPQKLEIIINIAVETESEMFYYGLEDSMTTQELSQEEHETIIAQTQMRVIEARATQYGLTFIKQPHGVQCFMIHTLLSISSNTSVIENIEGTRVETPLKKFLQQLKEKNDAEV